MAEHVSTAFTSSFTERVNPEYTSENRIDPVTQLSYRPPVHLHQQSFRWAGLHLDSIQVAHILPDDDGRPECSMR